MNGISSEVRSRALSIGVLWLLFFPFASGELVESWSASDLSQSDRSPVGTWRGSNGSRLTGSGNFRPLLLKNATPGGGAVLRFQANRLSGPSPVGGKSAFTIAVVARPLLTQDDVGNHWFERTGVIDATQLGVVDDWGIAFTSTGQFGMGTGRPDLSTFGTGDSLVDAQFHVGVFTWGNGMQAVYVDDRPRSVLQGVSERPRGNVGMSVGGLHHSNIITRRFAADIAEIRFYDTAFSEGEVQGLVTELRQIHLEGPGPVVGSFEADADEILIGESVTLNWEILQSEGALSLAIDQGVEPLPHDWQGSITVSPQETTTYTLTATDQNGVRTREVEVIVNSGAPVAKGERLRLPQFGRLPITLEADDPDSPEEVLSYTIVTEPRSGELSGTPPNILYTPREDFVGEDRFFFEVRDERQSSEPAEVIIEVTPGPQAPLGVQATNTILPRGAGPGDAVTRFHVLDQNVHDQHSYLLVPGFGDNADFEIVGNELRSRHGLVGRDGEAILLQVEVTDSAQLSHREIIHLSVGAPPPVVINEIRPSGEGLDGFVELHNRSDELVQLGGWKLTGSVDFVFPPGSVLGKGAYLLLARNISVLRSEYGAVAFESYGGALPTGPGGGLVELLDGEGAPVDRVDYGVGFPWPVAPAAGEASYERIHPSLDGSAGGNWRSSVGDPTPGRQNSAFALNAPPLVSAVEHGLEGEVPAEKEMPSDTPVIVSAQVLDPDGVAAVRLFYQVNRPGEFLPAEIPLTVPTLTSRADTQRSTNSEFTSPRNWTMVVMRDDGQGGDVVSGDGRYTAAVPGQMHRSLVRYRIEVRDGAVAPLSTRVPYEDDPSRNFAYYVYDEVPDFRVTRFGTSRIYPASELTQIPIYHFLTRNADLRECLGHSGTPIPAQNPGRLVHNWEGAFIYRGKVYDHVRYRLRGEDRYLSRGKRDMSIRFNEGCYFDPPTEDGSRTAVPWSELLVSKQSTDQVGNFGLAETINSRFWRAFGVPAQDTHWFHLRVVDSSLEGNPSTSGDFWGFFLGVEPIDGGFLQRRGLEEGNLYHHHEGGDDQVVQSLAGSPDGGDLRNINLFAVPGQNTQWIRDHVNMERWARWSAVKEGVAHTAFPNLGSYFEPNYRASNGQHGALWVLPGSAPNSWVPVEGQGKEQVGLAMDGVLELERMERNAVREFRDLFWQPDQMDALFDELFLKIASIQPADRDRWATNSGEGFENWGALEDRLDSMRRFAFGTEELPGGRASYLDDYAHDTHIPGKPFVRYNGEAKDYPIEIARDEAQFVATGYHHPAGIPFDAISWRLAEVGFDDRGQQHYEWDAQWESGPLEINETKMTIPTSVLVAGRSYRVRVRYRDILGRWSHWSNAEEFAVAAEDLAPLDDGLRITEIMFHPMEAGVREQTLGYRTADFAYVELQNIGESELELSNLQLEGAVYFPFRGSAILSLGAGESLLVVANEEAFLRRYGAGHRVAGEWRRGDALSPKGGLVAITHSWGLPLETVSFLNAAPWPVGESDGGYSITLKNPDRSADPSDPQSWRASRLRGGSPGTSDSIRLDDWLAAYRLAGPLADEDGDGNINMLEHVMGTNPRDPSDRALPEIAVGPDTVSFCYAIIAAADAVQVSYELSNDLVSWREVASSEITSAHVGSGRAKVTIELPRASLNSDSIYVRLRATLVE